MFRPLAVAGALAALSALASPAVAQTPTAAPSPSCGTLTLRSDLRNEGAEASPQSTSGGPLYLHLTASEPRSTYRLEVSSPYAGVVRSGSGPATDWTVYPLENTTLRVRSTVRGCGTVVSNSVRAYVRAVASIAARRHAPRQYVFSGSVRPAAGQLVTLYRQAPEAGGVITSQVRVQPDGTYRIERRFTGAGHYDFYVQIGQTSRNLSGVSAPRDTVIH